MDNLERAAQDITVDGTQGLPGKNPHRKKNKRKNLQRPALGNRLLPGPKEPRSLARCGLNLQTRNSANNTPDRGGVRGETWILYYGGPIRDPTPNSYLGFGFQKAGGGRSLRAQGNPNGFCSRGEVPGPRMPAGPWGRSIF